jgi:outer membrane murein-binding lipoprotein Lpp
MTIHGSRIFFPVCAVAVAGLVLAGCTKIRENKADTATANGNGQANFNGDSLRNQIQALAFSGPGHTRKRKMQGQPVGVRVKIRPVGDSYMIDSAVGPATPTIVAWIENQSNDTTTENPVFKPKDEAQYLVRVYRDSVNPEAKYQIIEVPSDAHGTVSVIKSGVLIGCHHPLPSHPDADFKSCDSVHTPFGVAANRTPFGFAKMSSGGPSLRAVSFVRSLMSSVVVLEDPTWIPCNAGCCTLSGTQSIY